jgi:hypothetical protein
MVKFDEAYQNNSTSLKICESISLPENALPLKAAKKFLTQAQGGGIHAKG